MIKIYHREYNDGMLLTIEGHSGYAPKGSDIVCAAVSSLALTLVNCLRDEECRGRLKLIRDITRDGYLSIEINLFDFSRIRIEAIIETVLSGFYMLSEEYPNYIRIDS